MRARTTRYQNNGPLNPLVHHLIDNASDPAIPPAMKQKLTEAFAEEYGVYASWDILVEKVNLIKDPTQREMILGPVLRQMLPAKYHNANNHEWPTVSPQDALTLANEFGFDMEWYGSEGTTDKLASVERPAGLSTEKLKIWNDSQNIYHYESNQAVERNKAYQQLFLINYEFASAEVKRRVAALLANINHADPAAEHDVNIAMEEGISQAAKQAGRDPGMALNKALSGASEIFGKVFGVNEKNAGVFTKVAQIIMRVFMGFMAGIPFLKDLGKLFAGLFQEKGDPLNDQEINDGNDPNQGQAFRHYVGVLPTAKYAKDLNELWRKKPDSPEVWIELMEQLDADEELFIHAEECLAAQEENIFSKLMRFENAVEKRQQQVDQKVNPHIPVARKTTSLHKCIDDYRAALAVLKDEDYLSIDEKSRRALFQARLDLFKEFAPQAYTVLRNEEHMKSFSTETAQARAREEKAQDFVRQAHTGGASAEFCVQANATLTDLTDRLAKQQRAFESLEARTSRSRDELSQQSTLPAFQRVKTIGTNALAAAQAAHDSHDELQRRLDALKQ